MRARRTAVAVVAAWLAVAGCSAPPITELVVVVRSELPMRRVTIQITNPEYELKVDREVDAPPFPLSVVLLRDHAPYGPVHVEVVGYGVGTVQRSATTAFVEGRRVELDLLLESACRCTAPCGPGFTCHAGACQNDAVDATMLPTYVAPEGGVMVIDAGPPSDGGGPTDFGPADAGVDAGHDAGTDGATDAGGLDAGHDGGAIDAGGLDGGHDAGATDAGPRDAGGAPDAGAPTGSGCGCQSEACCSASDCAPGLTCAAGICQVCTGTSPVLIGAYGGAVVKAVAGTASSLDITGTSSVGGMMRGSIALTGGIGASGTAVTMTYFTGVSATADTITFTDSTGRPSTIHLTGGTATGTVTFGAGTMGLSTLTAMGPRLTLGDGSTTHADIVFAAGETCH